MWIRSHNRKTLIEIHKVELDELNEIFCNDLYIGEYSTEEKALKVLDDIEHSLEYPYNSVFQMPADEDVEI